ncbi:MAG: cytochrome c [Pseudomonadota bacterium]
MLKKIAAACLIIGLVAAIVLWVLSAPATLSEQQIAAFPAGDAAKGENVFWAAGCASCHSAPKAKGDAQLTLTGGRGFATPFGTFFAPNISTDKEHGVGSWSLGDFANAVLLGTTPDGAHYFPAFPFGTYARMTHGDVADLWAYFQTLPADKTASKTHDVPFPFNVRRGVGLWKLLFFSTEPVLAFDNPSEQLKRGQYLVEALAHCGECHTPRNPAGGMRLDRWLAGGKAPEGDEVIPNITPHEDGIGDWSATDIVYSLETAFTPEFDSFGSSMVEVQENMARLPKSDREAIAAYLKAVPALAKE